MRVRPSFDFIVRHCQRHTSTFPSRPPNNPIHHLRRSLNPRELISDTLIADYTILPRPRITSTDTNTDRYEATDDDDAWEGIHGVARVAAQVRLLPP